MKANFIIVLIVLFLAGCAISKPHLTKEHSIFVNSSETSTVIEPDPGVQRKIGDTIEYIERPYPEGFIESMTAKELNKFIDSVIDPLLKTAKGDRIHLLRQLIYYHLKKEIDHPYTDYEHRLNILAIARGYLKATPKEWIEAINPYIGSSDPNLLPRKEEAISNLLYYQVDSTDEEFAVSGFTPYRSFIQSNQKKGKPVPLGLIDYMYKRYSNKALWTLAEVYNATAEITAILPNLEQATTEWTLAEVYNATAEITAISTNLEQATTDYRMHQKEIFPKIETTVLDKLSKHPEWWAQLYVAEMIRSNARRRKNSRRYRSFTYPNTKVWIERLSQSEHPLISKRIDEINEINELLANEAANQ